MTAGRTSLSHVRGAPQTPPLELPRDSAHFVRVSLSFVPVLAAALGIALATDDARADDPDRLARTERCASRLSIALLGKSPSTVLAAATNPQSMVGDLLKTPEFRDKLARFINATYNRDPGKSAADDAPYWMTLHLLERGRPWRELFVGPYNLVEDDEGKVTVRDDPEGLGYFRSQAWLRRYAGNEGSGLKISTAYRMMQNTVGLKLVAVTNEPNVDVSAAGRMKQPCNSCHIDNWYALDKVASVLTRRNGSGDEMVFDPPTGGPAQILGGITVANDKDLVTALVDSEAFRFRQCRLAFNYLYARDENLCEGPIFDACMTEFTAKGTIESAIGAVAGHASFCEDVQP
jgi:hypothetical protein